MKTIEIWFVSEGEVTLAQAVDYKLPSGVFGRDWIVVVACSADDALEQARAFEKPTSRVGMRRRLLRIRRTAMNSFPRGELRLFLNGWV